jgi:hypothetical protein
MKSGSLSLLEPSGLVQGCNGIAVPYIHIHTYIHTYIYIYINELLVIIRMTLTTITIQTHCGADTAS